MRRKLLLTGLCLMMWALAAFSQTARIMNVAPQGYVVEVEGNDMSKTFLSVKVKLQYGGVGEEDAGCIVVMSKKPFQAISNMDQLARARELYDMGYELLEPAAGQHTDEVDVYVQFDHLKTTDTAQTLYVQAVVLLSTDVQKVLSKSDVMTVPVKDMTIVDVYRSEEDIQRFANIFSGALGAGLGALSDDDCPYCHGKGEVEEKASYGSYTRECYYCEGTGRKPKVERSQKAGDASGDESGGSILDLFGLDMVREGLSIGNGGQQKKTNGKSKSKTRRK